jgi:hypothetical protein
MAHDDVEAAVLASAPEGVSHIGFVAFDVRNHVLILQPEDHAYGVSATLPRVRVKPDESAATTLDRCQKEKVGWWTTSAFPLRTVWVTENSSTFYVTGLIKDNDEPAEGELPQSSWCPLGVARSKIQSSKNRTTRNRDLAVLETASRIERSLYRRILLMVKELHRRGFGRLRAAPYMHQNGYLKPPGRWTCSIVPSVVMRADNGAFTDGDRLNRLRETLHIIQHYDPFDTVGSHQPFGWTDALFDSPSELADKFFARYRDLCFIGWGSDPEYERWYDQMLELSAPNGVFFPIGWSNEYVETAYAASDCRFRPPPLAAC